MFLYPLSKMSGGIYFEHAHRLFGSLVGLTTLTLAFYLQRYEPRRWVRRLAWAALAMVIVQGLLGALRVTGTFTLSQNAEDLTPNLGLAVVHGVFGQMFFSTLVALAVFTSNRWRTAPPAQVRANAGGDQALALIVVVLLLIQIITGAVFRHLNNGLYVHLGLAVVVLIAAGLVGLRAWLLDDDTPILPTLGERFILVLGAQLVLGALALGGVMLTSRAGAPVAWEVLATTAHQTCGALVFATAVMLALWQFRLFRGVEASALAGPRAVDARASQGARGSLNSG